MVNTSRDKIIAYVSPRSIGGRSIFAPHAELRAGSIAHYRSERNVTSAAVSKIEEMGFKVEAVSELTIKISGTAAQKKMGVKFQKDESAMLVPTPDSPMNALDLGSEVLEGAAFPQPVEPHSKQKSPGKKGTGRRATKPPSGTKKAAKTAKARAKALASGISAVAPDLA